MSDQLRGGAARLVYLHGFERVLSEIKESLLTDVNLEEHKRRAFVIVLSMVKEGFTETYQKFDIQVPDWVKEI